jgi:hypothetical protein
MRPPSAAAASGPARTAFEAIELLSLLVSFLGEHRADIVAEL